MASLDEQPKNLGELIDEIERIREELLVIQRSMEKIESGEPSRADGEADKNNIK